MNSTYGLKKDWSYRGEEFYIVPLTWRLGVCGIDILKIRIANWRSKYNRSNQAIFYYDVKSKEEANKILDLYKDYNFKTVENWFEKEYKESNIGHTTGVVNNWLDTVIIPAARKKFNIVIKY